MDNNGISNPDDREYFPGWKELESKIITMDVSHPSSRAQDSESNSSSPVSDKDIMLAAKEDSGIKEIMKLTKEKIRSNINCYASPNVKECLEKEDNEGFWDRVMNSVKEFINYLKDTIASIWDKVMEILKKIFKFLEGIIKSFFEKVEDILLSKFFTNVEEAAEKGVKIVTKLLSDEISEAFNRLAKGYVHI